jgi:hypothetical protein
VNYEVAEFVELKLELEKYAGSCTGLSVCLLSSGLRSSAFELGFQAAATVRGIRECRRNHNYEVKVKHKVVPLLN